MVLGAAFGAVVTSLVSNIITPLIAALGGEPDFGALSFRIGDGVLRYGAFLNALLSFLIIAAVLFYFVVKPMNALLARVKRDEEELVSPAPDVHSRPPPRPPLRVTRPRAGAERPARRRLVPTLRHSATKSPTVRFNIVTPTGGRLCRA